MEVLTLDDVYYTRKEGPQKSVVKMATSGIGIKVQGVAEITTITADEIKEIVEHYGVIDHTVKIVRKNGTVCILDGVTAEHLENIKQYAKKHYKLNIYHKALSVEGGVHGQIEVQNTSLEFKAQDRAIFDVPLGLISNAYERKGEGIIDIDETYFGVSEIRFGCLKEESNVLQLIELIKSSSAGSDQLEVFSIDEVACILPRGKSKLSLTATCMYLIGKRYSHQMLFSSITRMFYLERSMEEGVEEMSYLIFELSTPVRQGQTRYHFVNLLLPEDKIKATLGKNSTILYADEEEELPVHEEDKEKIEELGLKYVQEGSLSECVVGMVEKLSGINSIHTGTFTTSTGSKALKCSLKANEGFLYPLKKGFLFVPQIAYIEYDLIKTVEFSRVNLSSRTAKTFDVRVIMQDKKEYMFNSIQKVEYNALEAYLTKKEVHCLNEVVNEVWTGTNSGDDDEETASDETSEELSEESDPETEQNSEQNTEQDSEQNSEQNNSESEE
ncbi:structure-specific recognition protein 1 [Nematocida minor]|uniref:structure-specific recognition protein 1 n=1 Tax=Nematocida minor TaxID=1912983 RepID=UPI0022206FA1|nr:structure-specific recognition protein 1 [Nematocida minor]XP_051332062.1 structure-specific recognition protein 1 [Nematocida minor]KAI5188792.1 structure-specific recognition protein 1 [Nematocida minor]KAI5188896.1 structure-specific recognition protein 1 [Nematocida minor]